MIPFENHVTNGLKFMIMFVSCHLANIFVFSDVPTLALKSHGISGHVTVR